MTTNAHQEATEVKKKLAQKTPQEINNEVWCLFFSDIHLPIFSL
jgi:hypothetical protein